MMDRSQGFEFFSVFPLFLVVIPFAVGLYLVAGRLGRNKIAWVILALIPVVNYFFLIYAFFVVLLHVLDQLRDIKVAASNRPR